MRQIFTIGESLYDIIFKGGRPHEGKPGGAMLNSSVSLGRAGLPVSFISEYADDETGNLIDAFLVDNGVGNKFIRRYSDGKTALAIAVLNEKNDASYTFYKDYPEHRLQMEFPRVQTDDIVLFGSIYAITKEIRARLVQFISTSAKNGAIVIYDPNFRTAHAPGLAQLKPLILENMQMSAIVRGSDEDFRNIFQAESPDSAWSVVGNYSPCLVYTASADAVYVRTAGFSGMFPVRKITPVSTIGAGDNFNAGMIAAIYRAGIKKDELEMMGEEAWRSVITAGMDFATDVCMSYENYISRELAGKYRGGT